MKIAVGSDPNAKKMKQEISEYVVSLGHEVIDYGSEDPIYANVAFKVGEEVAGGHADRGMLFCGTGIGMALAANQVDGVYAATVTSVYQAQRAVLSNNANIITMGEQVTGIEVAKMMAKEYLSYTFDPFSSSGPKVARIEEYGKERKK